MGFLADLVGNAADSGKAILDKDIASQIDLERQNAAADHSLGNQKQLSRFNEEIRQAHDITVEKLRVQLQDDMDQRKQSRLMTQTAAAEQGAQPITAARQLAQANQRAPSLDSTGMGMIKSALSPDQIKSAYGVDVGDKVAELDDQIKAGNQAGGFDAVAELRKQRKETTDTLRAEALQRYQIDKLSLDEKRADQRDATLREGLKVRKEIADERLGAGASGGKGGGGGSDQERKRWTSLMNRLGQDINSAQSSLKSVYDPEEKKQIQSNINDMQEQKKHYMEKLAGSQSGDAPEPTKPAASPAPSIKALPTGAVPIGTSGGKQVFQTPDGKRFIAN